MGCLMAPIRMLGFVLLLVLLLLGWLYRDRLVSMAEAAWREGTGQPAVAIEAGVPSAAALASADRKVASLVEGADSVVLTAAEAASLFRRGLEPYARDIFDSMAVRLHEDRVGVSATIRTERLPAGVLGPFASAVREREPISADGPIRVLEPGRGEWEVRRLQFRDIPLPRDAVPRLLGRALGDTGRRAVPLVMPDGVAGVRVRPGGVTLYRSVP